MRSSVARAVQPVVQKRTQAVANRIAPRGRGERNPFWPPAPSPRRCGRRAGLRGTRPAPK
eukprot:3520895-Pyramimonas_sp.AAC.1